VQSVELRQNLACNLVCNPEMYYDTLMDGSTVNLNQFNGINTLLPFWQATANTTPDWWDNGINREQANLPFTSSRNGSLLLYGSVSEIATTVLNPNNIINGQNYLVSFYRRNHPNINNFPAQSQTNVNFFIANIYSNNNTPNNWERIIFRIPINNWIPFIPLFLSFQNTTLGSYLELEQIEFVPDHFSAGTNDTISCCDTVILGNNIACDLSNTQYQWETTDNNGQTTIIRPWSSNPLDTVVVCATTTYTLRRRWVMYPNIQDPANPTPTLAPATDLNFTAIPVMNQDLVSNVTITVLNCAQLSITSRSNCPNITLSATAIPPNTNYTYQWSGSGVMGATTPSVNVSVAGTYTVTVSLSGSQVATQSITLTSADFNRNIITTDNWNDATLPFTDDFWNSCSCLLTTIGSSQDTPFSVLDNNNTPRTQSNNVWFKFHAPNTQGFQIKLLSGTTGGQNFGNIFRPILSLWRLNANGTLDSIDSRYWYTNYSNYLMVGYANTNVNDIYYVSIGNENLDWRGTFTICMVDEPSNDFIQGAEVININTNGYIACSKEDAYFGSFTSFNKTFLDKPVGNDLSITTNSSIDGTNNTYYMQQSSKPIGQFPQYKVGKSSWFRIDIPSLQGRTFELYKGLYNGDNNCVTSGEGALSGNNFKAPYMSLWLWDDTGDGIVQSGELLEVNTSKYDVSPFNPLKLSIFNTFTTNRTYFLSVYHPNITTAQAVNTTYNTYFADFRLVVRGNANNDLIQGAHDITNLYENNLCAQNPSYTSYTDPNFIQHFMEPYATYSSFHTGTLGVISDPSSIDGPNQIDNVPCGYNPTRNVNRNVWFRFNSGSHNSIGLRVRSIVNATSLTVRLWSINGNTLTELARGCWTNQGSSFSASGLSTNTQYFISVEGVGGSSPATSSGVGSFRLCVHNDGTIPGATERLAAPSSETKAPTLPTKITIYPNPTNGNWLNVDLPLAESAYTLELYDVNGKLCKQMQTSKTTETINVEDLANGMYLLKAINGKIQESQKVMIQK